MNGLAPLYHGSPVQGGHECRPSLIAPSNKGGHDTQRSRADGSASLPACQKSPDRTFLTALQPPSILPPAKCCYLKKHELSSFFRRRFIQLEAGLAPSSSPAALFSDCFAKFFDSLAKKQSRWLCFFALIHFYMRIHFLGQASAQVPQATHLSSSRTQVLAARSTSRAPTGHFLAQMVQ